MREPIAVNTRWIDDNRHQLLIYLTASLCKEQCFRCNYLFVESVAWSFLSSLPQNRWCTLNERRRMFSRGYQSHDYVRVRVTRVYELYLITVIGRTTTHISRRRAGDSITTSNILNFVSTMAPFFPIPFPDVLVTRWDTSDRPL